MFKEGAREERRRSEVRLLNLNYGHRKCTGENIRVFFLYKKPFWHAFFNCEIFLTYRKVQTT